MRSTLLFGNLFAVNNDILCISPQKWNSCLSNSIAADVVANYDSMKVYLLYRWYKLHNLNGYFSFLRYYCSVCCLVGKIEKICTYSYHSSGARNECPQLYLNVEIANRSEGWFMQISLKDNLVFTGHHNRTAAWDFWIGSDDICAFTIVLEIFFLLWV